MRGTFGEGLNRFEKSFGRGPLVGHIEVDQIYAHYQHDNDAFRHPRGGKSGFIRDPLYARNHQHMSRLADNLIVEDGSKIENAMADVMEDMSLQVFIQAPEEFGDLRASGHPFVESNGHIVYDRAPNMHRLTDSELRAKSNVRSLFGKDIL